MTAVRARIIEPDELVDVTAIAERLNVRPDTVHKWRQRHATFPAPFAQLAVGPIWLWPDVAAWSTRERSE